MFSPGAEHISSARVKLGLHGFVIMVTFSVPVLSNFFSFPLSLGFGLVCWDVFPSGGVPNPF